METLYGPEDAFMFVERRIGNVDGLSWQGNCIGVLESRISGEGLLA
ncbi:MAG: hypothetical protein OXH68_07670 [Gammaproteobacteria bacterium]|nr:hypothetical protein [Gammaproteobacteria bacterium]